MTAYAGLSPILGTLVLARVLVLVEAQVDAHGSWGERFLGSFSRSRPSPAPAFTLSFPVPPEVRDEKCISATFDLDTLPHASLVIPYLNETWRQIRATVASVLAHTPLELVDEILFIDDGNSEGWQYHEGLRALHPKVRVHRNEQRQGLIQSKVIGAALVQSPVVIFMEPHCIVSRQWVEPLLLQLSRSASHGTLVMPILDVIPESNFNAYQAAQHHIGGFDWKLNFNWVSLIEWRNTSYQYPDPYPTPALSGGIFGIWRDYWERMGTYDVNMSEWGGEHIEMSLRVWRCGGRIEIVPCSRMGHVFRAKNPYIVDHAKVIRNQKRAALVWLDERLEDFYREVPAARDLDAGDVEERLQLKAGLDCRSLDWYIQNVYPELLTGGHPRGTWTWRSVYVPAVAVLSILPWLPWRVMAVRLRRLVGKRTSDSE